MRARERIGAFVVALGIAGGGAASCREATQVSIDVHTNVPCALVRRTSITAGSPQPSEAQLDPTTVTSYCQDGFIGTLVMVPSSAKNASLAIRVVTGVDRDATECSAENGYAGCIVARRRLAYVAHTSLRVPITMYLSCKDVACDVRSTCNKLGQCVASEVDPGQCATPEGCSVSGEVPGPDGGAPGEVDASDDRTVVSDAAPDAASGDGGGTSDGGQQQGPTPGVVYCPGAPGNSCSGATPHCCFNRGTGTAVGCIAANDFCSGSINKISCDGTDDCNMGMGACCLTPSGTFCGSSPTQCSAQSIPQLCTVSAQCMNGWRCDTGPNVPAYKYCQP